MFVLTPAMNFDKLIQSNQRSFLFASAITDEGVNTNEKN